MDNNIYLKIYVENDDTLVFEGQGDIDVPHIYYPTAIDDTRCRIGTVVIGAKHIAISEAAKKAFIKIVTEANHTNDDISCIDIHSCYSWNEAGKVDIDRGCCEVSVSYIGPIISKFNINKVIDDPKFFIGCGEGAPELSLLDKLVII